MITLTLLEKARRGRRNAIASLANRRDRTSNVVSIFDYAFEERETRTSTAGSNVIAFRSARSRFAAEPKRLAA